MDSYEIEKIVSKFLKERYYDGVCEFADNYPDSKSLYVPYGLLVNFDNSLEDAIRCDPLEFMEGSTNAILNLLIPVDKVLEGCTLRLIGYPEQTMIRDIGTKHVLQMVCVVGTVTRVTDVNPKVVTTAFECMRCGHTMYVNQPDEKFVVPMECENDMCGRKGPYRELHTLSTFKNHQTIEIQEKFELINDSQPRVLRVTLQDELTNTVTAGDNVTVVGIINIVQKTNREGKTTLYKIRMDSNNLEKEDNGLDDVKISDAELEQIKEIAQSSDAKKRIVDSIAPNVYGHKSFKEGAALQLVSGNTSKVKGSHIRGDIHILVVGEPGVAKSVMLKYISTIAPKCVFNAGTGSSGVGLTATVGKSTLEEGKWEIRGGSMVMADNGTCIVDELDKMSDESRDTLHEALEQQVVTINKATVHASLNSRCALLCAANPKSGFFKEDEPIATQIGIKASLVSRFDLIYIMRDEPNERNDGAIALQILKNRMNGGKIAAGINVQEDEIELIAPELLRKYIAYARRTIHPIMEKPQADRLYEIYTQMRLTKTESGRVRISPRQLEGMVRLAEASAKIRLSQVVSDQDITDSIKLMVDCRLNVEGEFSEGGLFDYGTVVKSGEDSQRIKMKKLKRLAQGRTEISKMDLIEHWEYSLEDLDFAIRECNFLIRHGKDNYVVCL